MVFCTVGRLRDVESLFLSLDSSLAPWRAGRMPKLSQISFHASQSRTHYKYRLEENVIQDAAVPYP
jgi:hypothetical protein